MQRIFSKLTVKAIDEDQRVVEGIASTPTPDRVGDIVEPMGAEYNLPIPFLLDHNHSEAVGEVELAEVTPKGIRFRARIKKIDEPGLAKDLVDRAWHLLKHGLRKAVSIGFQPLASEPLPDGGYRFTRWDWYELSAVTVPAQQDAVVTGVKRAPQPSGHIVRLSKDDIRKGKIEAEIDRWKDLGIRGKPVKLTADDIVSAKLAARKTRQSKRTGDHIVRLRP